MRLYDVFDLAPRRRLLAVLLSPSPRVWCILVPSTILFLSWGKGVVAGHNVGYIYVSGMDAG